MVLNQINIRCKQLIIRCLFTLSCCPEDHCQKFFWVGPSFLAHPLYTLFVNIILVNLESTILFSLIRFGKKSWLLALLLKRKSCPTSLEINRSYKLSSTSRLCYSHSVAKKAFFHSAHASSENLGLLSDSPYQGSLEFYIHSKRKLLSRHPSFI